LLAVDLFHTSLAIFTEEKNLQPVSVPVVEAPFTKI